MPRFAPLALVVVLLCGCDFPRDPEGTLDRVRGGVMRVGVSPAEPFVQLTEGQEPAGVEVELGHVIAVEVLAVPRDDADLLDRVEAAVEGIRDLDWKLQDVVVAVVREIDGAPEDVLVR